MFFCGKILISKAECHFDHIVVYSKGGKSTLNNCQILCLDCNLSKSDKEMHEFLLEEKAKRFMLGETIGDNDTNGLQEKVIAEGKMTKEKFDLLVGDFIKKHGKIIKVDFTRDKNGLPSLAYVKKYYDTINNLKLCFGLKIDTVWNRNIIWERLVEYSQINPEFKQSDLTRYNNLPSLPCVLSYYPEFKNFSDIKIALGHELNYELWTEERVREACQKYLQTHNKITLKDLKRENGLPTSKVIYRIFVGTEISYSQEFISKDEILRATKGLIAKEGYVYESRSAFFKKIPL